MERRPLGLTAPVRPLVFGGRSIERRLGREGLPDWAVAETWEVSDVEGNGSAVVGGPLAGRSLRSLAEEFPQELMGRGWRGAFFPLLTKFIDAEGTLPVHLHADDATAPRVENQAIGKTEAWHILQADPGTTALCGVREGVDREQLHRALVAQDFDSVLRRLTVRAGETVYVPGGTLHSFGPRTLVYEIEQTSDVQQHAMRWNTEDGSPVGEQQWRSNLEALMAEVRLDSRPDFHTGLRIGVGDGVDRVLCCAGPYFALERWRAGTPEALRRSFSTAQILTNVGPPVEVSAHGRSEELGRGQSLLLPAVMGQVQIPGPADVLFGYLPDLALDVRGPLIAAGCSPDAVAALGGGV